MRNYTFSLILFTSSLLVSLQANEDHIHHGHKHHGHESSQLMFAYQIGYAEIHSKNNHMSDDSRGTSRCSHNETHTKQSI